MYIVNSRKAGLRSELYSDLQSSATGLNAVLRAAEGSVSALSSLLGGSSLDARDGPAEQGKLAAEKLREAVRGLQDCRALLEQLEVREEADDDQH